MTKQSNLKHTLLAFPTKVEVTCPYFMTKEFHSVLHCFKNHTEKHQKNTYKITHSSSIHNGQELGRIQQQKDGY